MIMLSLLLSVIVVTDYMITEVFDNGLEWDDNIGVSIIKRDGTITRYKSLSFPIVGKNDVVKLNVNLKKEYKKQFPKGGILCFYVYHSVIKASYKGEEFFSKCEDIAEKGDMIGKTLVEIPIPEEAWGSSVQVQLEVRENQAYSSLSDFCIYNNINNYQYISARNFVEFIISLTGMCGSVVILLLIIILTDGLQRRQGIFLLSLMFCLSAWVLMNFGHNNLFSRAYFWRPFEYFSLMLSPIFLSAYIMLLKPKYKRFWKVLMITDSGWCVIMFFMNRMNIFHVNETMYITHIFIVITCIGTLVFSIKKINENEFSTKVMFAAMFLLMFFAFIEIVSYYVEKYFKLFKNRINMPWLFVGLVIFMILFFIHFVLHVIEEREKKLQAEIEKENNIKQLKEALEYTNLKISLNQMKPHFMYNVLCSIQVIIKKDSNYAYDLLYDFMIYLRSNIKTLQGDTMIPFLEELENIKVYLNIEKMRHSDNLEIIYDIRCSDFCVAPLSIEPLVENAASHGILPKGGSGGTITIRSMETENSWKVEIIDNGVGFDVDTIYDENHSGLRNIKYRAQLLMEADIDIRSKMGKGTHVTVEIPKKKRRAFL